MAEVEGNPPGHRIVVLCSYMAGVLQGARMVQTRKGERRKAKGAKDLYLFTVMSRYGWTSKSILVRATRNLIKVRLLMFTYKEGGTGAACTE